MTKNRIKAISLAAVMALSLTACSEQRETVNISDSVSSVAEESSVSSSSTTSKLETSSNSSVESSTTSSATSSVKPAETSASSTETSSKPAEKPVENTTSTTTSTTVTNPVEKTTTKTENTHTHDFTGATCTDNGVCTICGEVGEKASDIHLLGDDHCHGVIKCEWCGIITETIPVKHYFNNKGKCVCGATNSDYVAPSTEDQKATSAEISSLNTTSVNNSSATSSHTHTWGNSYTEVETRTEEIQEAHEIKGTGYDMTLAMRYFGRLLTYNELVEAIGDPNGSSGTNIVKTTNTINTTKYFHKCTECGYTEMYDSSEEVIPSNKWELVHSRVAEGIASTDVIWWDPNDVPQQAIDDVRADVIAREAWLNETFGVTGYTSDFTGPKY